MYSAAVLPERGLPAWAGSDASAFLFALAEEKWAAGKVATHGRSICHAAENKRLTN